MKILVTGSTGFIGRHVAKACAANGCEVYGISLSKSPGHNSFSCDLLKPINLPIKPDTVIHLAAEVPPLGVSTSVTFRKNVRMTRNVLEFCRKNKVPTLVYASALSVYGKQLRGTITEETPTNPQSPYAESKVVCEALCFQYEWLYGIRVVILRYPTVYGPGEPPTGIIIGFINSCREKKDITIPRDRYINVVPVTEISRATALAATLNKSGVFNLAAPQFTRMSDLAKSVVRATGRKCRIDIEIPSAPKLLCRIPNSRAVRAFEFDPPDAMPNFVRKLYCL